MVRVYNGGMKFHKEILCLEKSGRIGIRITSYKDFLQYIPFISKFEKWYSTKDGVLVRYHGSQLMKPRSILWINGSGNIDWFHHSETRACEMVYQDHQTWPVDRVFVWNQNRLVRKQP